MLPASSFWTPYGKALWTNIKKNSLRENKRRPALLEALTSGLLGEALRNTISSEFVAKKKLNNPILRMHQPHLKTPAFVGWCCRFLLGGTRH